MLLKKEVLSTTMSDSDTSSPSPPGLTWFHSRLSSLPLPSNERSLGADLPLKIHSQLRSLLRLLEALPGSAQKQIPVKYAPTFHAFRRAVKRLENLLTAMPVEEQEQRHHL